MASKGPYSGKEIVPSNQVHSLGYLSVCAIVRQIWTSSKLPSLLVSNNYRNKYINRDSIIKSNKKHDEILRSLRRKILSSEHIPVTLRPRLVVRLNTLDTDVNGYIELMMCFFVTSKSNLAKCLKNLDIDWLCEVNIIGIDADELTSYFQAPYLQRQGDVNT